MKEQFVMPKEEARCYRLDGILFVPAYDQRPEVAGLYIGPGGRMNTAARLIERGATATMRFLWPRQVM